MLTTDLRNALPCPRMAAGPHPWEVSESEAVSQPVKGSPASFCANLLSTGYLHLPWASCIASGKGSVGVFIIIVVICDFPF